MINMWALERGETWHGLLRELASVTAHHVTVADALGAAVAGALGPGGGNLTFQVYLLFLAIA